MTISKSYYDVSTGEIHADSKLEYYHEQYHKILHETTNFNLLTEISFFILIYAIVFSTKEWQIAGFVLFFGLEMLEELAAWKYAYKMVKQK